MKLLNLTLCLTCLYSTTALAENPDAWIAKMKKQGYEVALNQKYQQDGDTLRIAVLTKTDEMAAAAEGDKVWLKEWLQAGKDWEMSAENKDYEVGAAGGVTAELVQIGADAHGVLLSEGGNSVGGSIYATQELLVSADDNEFMKIFALENGSYFSNAGSCDLEATPTDCFNFEAKIEFVEGDNPEYKDILVTESGNRYDNNLNKVVPADNKQVWKYEGGVYKKVAVNGKKNKKKQSSIE